MADLNVLYKFARKYSEKSFLPIITEMLITAFTQAFQKGSLNFEYSQAGVEIYPQNQEIALGLGQNPVFVKKEARDRPCFCLRKDDSLTCKDFEKLMKFLEKLHSQGASNASVATVVAKKEHIEDHSILLKQVMVRLRAALATTESRVQAILKEKSLVGIGEDAQLADLSNYKNKTGKKLRDQYGYQSCSVSFWEALDNWIEAKQEKTVEKFLQQKYEFYSYYQSNSDVFMTWIEESILAFKKENYLPSIEQAADQFALKVLDDNYLYRSATTMIAG